MAVETLNYFVALATLFLQVGTLALLIAYFFRDKSTFIADVVAPISRWGIWAALLMVLGALVMSLYYSDVLGFEPCPLCWWMRIFMYPQVILFALALWLKDRNVTVYSIALSVIGMGVGLYNHALQVLPGSALPCPATGTVSCSQRIIFEFGYITFPLVGVSLFAFLIVLMLYVRADRKDALLTYKSEPA